MAQAASEEAVTAYLQTKEGKKKSLEKVKELLMEYTELLKEAKVDIKQFSKDLKNTKKKLTSVVKRKTQFDQGKDFSKHGFATKNEAKEAVAEATSELAEAQAAHDALTEDIEEYKQALHEKGAKEVLARKRLVGEEQDTALRKVVAKHRLVALQNNWRRPWDGHNGSEFQKWIHRRNRPSTRKNGDGEEEQVYHSS